MLFFEENVLGKLALSTGCERERGVGSLNNIQGNEQREKRVKIVEKI